MPICPPNNPQVFFQTNGNGDPINQGAREAYIVGFNADKELSYATYFGGDQNDDITAAIFAPVVDDLYFVGHTRSVTNFPLESPSIFPNAYQQEDMYGSQDGFIAKLSVKGAVVGVEKVEGKKPNEFLTIFPNPSSNLIQVEMSNGVQSSCTLQLFNSTGKRILEIDLEPWQKTINLDITEIPAGVYTILVNGISELLIKI